MIFSIRSAQIFSEQRSMNESQTWTSLSTSACESMLDWLNWTLNQSSKHQLLKLLALSSAHQSLNSRHQFLRERNSEDRSSILFRKSCLRKNFASNARSQNIKHMTASRWLKCMRSLRVWKTICLHQSSDWEWYTHICYERTKAEQGWSPNQFASGLAQIWLRYDSTLFSFLNTLFFHQHLVHLHHILLVSQTHFFQI